MKTKRLVALLLTCILLVGIFSGCNNNDEEFTWSEIEIVEQVENNNEDNNQSSDNNSKNNNEDNNQSSDNNSKNNNEDNNQSSDNNSKNNNEDNNQSSDNNSKNSENQSGNNNSSSKDNNLDNSKVESGNNVNSNSQNPVDGNITIPEKFKKMNYKGTTITVLLWYEPKPSEQKVYDEFAKMTGCKFKFIQLGTSTMVKKLTAMVSANNSPDMVPLDENNFLPCVSSKLIQPMTSYIDKKDSWVAWDMVESSKYNGEYYGITTKMWGDNIFVYFNKDLFRKSTAVSKTPLDYYNEGKWTWDVFADLATKMTIKDKSGSVTQLGCQSNVFGAFALSAGGSFIKYENAKFYNTLNTKHVKAAAQLEKGLIEKGSISYTTDTWSQGKVAMFINPQYALRDPDVYNSIWKFDWDWVPFPKYTDGKSYQPITIQMGSIPVKAKNAKAAYDFINWRCFCISSMIYNIGNTKDEYVNRWNKALSGNTAYGLDAAVLGNARFTIAQELIKANSDTQTTIDAYVPQVNEAIKKFENTMASFGN